MQFTLQQSRQRPKGSGRGGVWGGGGVDVGLEFRYKVLCSGTEEERQSDRGCTKSERSGVLMLMRTFSPPTWAPSAIAGRAPGLHGQSEAISGRLGTMGGHWGRQFYLNLGFTFKFGTF